MSTPRTKPSVFLEWGVVASFAVFMVLASVWMLYPKITNENILVALRFSSLTTAIPFLLLFAIRPLATVRNDFGRWLQNNHRTLWLTLTLSHLIHLYQIILFYQLGQSCPLSVWLVTSPLWLTMVTFSAIELIKPQLLDQIYLGQIDQANSPGALSLLHGIGVWYIWFVFTLAFGLGALAKHLPFYNIPALILFLAGASAYGIVGWKRRSAT